MGVFTMQGQGIPCCSTIRFGTPPPPRPHQRASAMPRRGPQQTRQDPPVGPKAGGRAAPPNSQDACSTPHAPLSASGEHPATPRHTHPGYIPPSHAWSGALEMSEIQAFPKESGLEGGEGIRFFFFSFLLAITPPWLN
eukprot:XP_016877573.1 uncharacterized protein LOC283710 isoform X2 [Homo sapiens]